MTAFNITSSSSTPQTLNSGELGYIGRNGALVVPGGTAVTMNDGAKLILDGSIASTATGVNLFASGTISISPTGEISDAANIGIVVANPGQKDIHNAGYIYGSSHGIGWQASGIDTLSLNVVNSGTIFGGNHAGVFGLGIGSESTIQNSGTIEGGEYGIEMRSLNDATWSVVNSGTIMGGVGIFDEVQNTDSEVVNTGQIIARDGSMGFMALDLHDGMDRLINSGEIMGAVDFGTGVGTDVLRNTGAIHGDVSGLGAGSLIVNGGLIDGTFTGSTGADSMKNWGVMADVSLGDGSDFFRNIGHVVGNIDLGKGSDLFKGWGGTVDGTIHGGAGSDTILGGLADDVIFGEAGDDVLKGGNGDDTITGGPGRDMMSGGHGFDTFNFNSLADSAANGQRNHILDFKQGEDVIDLSTIDAKAGVNGNQAFHFIGSAPLSGTAKGELHAVNSGANTLVAGDTNGDGSADFSILVVGVHGLTAEDFVL